MREYKITKSDLGYQVYREDGEIRERLQRGSYTSNKNFARVFYHLDDALSALQIAKAIGKKETPITSIKKSESEEKRERTSWSELS